MKEKALKRPIVTFLSIISIMASLVFTSVAAVEVTSTKPQVAPIPIKNVANIGPTIQGQIQLLKDLLALTSRVEVLEREVRELKAKRQ